MNHTQSQRACRETGGILSFESSWELSYAGQTVIILSRTACEKLTFISCPNYLSAPRRKRGNLLGRWSHRWGSEILNMSHGYTKEIMPHCGRGGGGGWRLKQIWRRKHLMQSLEGARCFRITTVMALLYIFTKAPVWVIQALNNHDFRRGDAETTPELAKEQRK